MKKLLLLSLLAILTLPTWSYAHESARQELVPCSVEFHKSYTVFTLSPSLRFIKSHFEIPSKIKGFTIPVIAVLENGRSYSGTIELSSKKETIKLTKSSFEHRVPFDDELQAKEYSVECYLII